MSDIKCKKIGKYDQNYFQQFFVGYVALAQKKY